MDLERKKTKLEHIHGKFPIFTLKASQFFILPAVKVVAKSKPLVQLLLIPSYILHMSLQMLFQDKENRKGQGNISIELWKNKHPTLKL